MKRRNLIPILIIISILFNIGFVVFSQHEEDTNGWPLFNIGPAVFQDSYSIRAPGLESPFGLIGDVPGGYPLYSGSPLQSNPSFNNSTIGKDVMGYLIVAIGFVGIPLVAIFVLGRRSYGSSKTH